MPCLKHLHDDESRGRCYRQGGGLYAFAGVSPGLLFDWAIPLMTAYATEGVKPDQGSVYWALSALQHGLQGCNNQTVTRYGNALLDACQRLLEADTLPEHLLPLLLHVISQVQILDCYDTGCNAMTFLSSEPQDVQYSTVRCQRTDVM